MIGEATASWSSDFFMLRAVNGAIVQVDGVEKGRTEVRDGFITGMITVTSGEDKADVVIDRSILAAYETFSYVATDIADPDSYCADGTTFAPANFSAKVVIVPDDVTTVSYTHLDVYKRQVMSQAYTLMNTSQVYDRSSAMMWLYFVLAGLFMGGVMLLYNRFCLKRWD